MQPVAGCIHVLRHAGYVKSSKKSTKTVGMFWAEFRLWSRTPQSVSAPCADSS
jgi:hypothetical protein